MYFQLSLSNDNFQTFVSRSHHKSSHICSLVAYFSWTKYSVVSIGIVLVLLCNNYFDNLRYYLWFENNFWK